MKESPKPHGHIVTPLIFFVLSAVVAVFLLIGAFVMWLASLVNSIAVAALITAGFFTVLALVIYFLSVHAAVQYVHDRLELIYEVSSRINDGFSWFSDHLSFLSFFHKSK